MSMGALVLIVNKEWSGINMYENEVIRDEHHYSVAVRTHNIAVPKSCCFAAYIYICKRVKAR